MISEEQSFRECLALSDTVIGLSGGEEAKVEALRACVAHPCAYHELDLPELYYELGELLCGMKRYDESLEAFEAYISSGARTLPHPRANVAEVLLQAGRLDEAEAIFTELRRQCPDDIWLYNFAGFAYSKVGDYPEALLWLNQGIAIALEDGDRDRILGQLSDERSSCRKALGLSDDELKAHVADFERPETLSSWFDPQNKRFEDFGEAYPDQSPCSHCGWDSNYDIASGMFLDELGSALGHELDHSDLVVSQDFEGRVRASKVGRNAPCPCGSGRKYKHCCSK